MSIGSAFEWVLNRSLTPIVRALHRARLIRGVHVTMSKRAEACWEAARHDAGGPESMNAVGLLRRLLDAPDCGLVRLLTSEGADIEALRVRLQSIAPTVEPERGFHSAFSALLRRSYEVVPEDVVEGQHDRRQVLHTVHFLRGFVVDPSEAGAALREVCPLVDRLRRDSIRWTDWYDAG